MRTSCAAWQWGRISQSANPLTNGSTPLHTTHTHTMNTSILIIPAVFFVTMVAIFGWRKAPGIFLGIMAACAVIYVAAAIVHA
jgi:hypothetical protein